MVPVRPLLVDNERPVFGGRFRRRRADTIAMYRYAVRSVYTRVAALSKKMSSNRCRTWDSAVSRLSDFDSRLRQFPVLELSNRRGIDVVLARLRGVVLAGTCVSINVYTGSCSTDKNREST